MVDLQRDDEFLGGARANARQIQSAINHDEIEWLAETVCYNAQQLAEKFLKNACQICGRKVCRTHDLSVLYLDLVACGAMGADRDVEADLEFLSRYGTKSRYLEFTPDERSEAVAAIAHVKHFCSALAAEGLPSVNLDTEIRFLHDERDSIEDAKDASPAQRARSANRVARQIKQRHLS